MNALTPEIQALIYTLGIAYFFISFFNVAIGLSLMAVAMLFSPEFTVGYVSMQPITIRIEDIAIPILTMALVAQLSMRRQTNLIVASPLNKPILLVLSISLLSTLWGTLTGWISFNAAIFYYVKTVEYFAIFYLVLNYVQTEKQIRIFLFFTILTVALIGLYTLMQVPSVQIWSAHRITAPFEGDKPEPATMGGYMAFLLLILLSIFLYEKRLPMKWFYGVLIIIIFIPFLFTLNRASYIALFLGLIYLAIREKRKWLRVLVVCAILSSPLWAPNSVKDRIAYTWQDAKNPGRTLGVDSSFQERILTWTKVLNTWKLSPFIGWGLTSFPTPDSQWARTLHEVGIIGLGLWIWLFVRLYKLSDWLFKSLDTGLFKGVALGYQAGLLALIVHGFGAITFYIIRIMEPFWFVTGLIVALYLIKVREFVPART